MYMLSENEISKSKTLECDNNNITCSITVGGTEIGVYTDLNTGSFSNPRVWAGDDNGQSLGDGNYTVSHTVKKGLEPLTFSGSVQKNLNLATISCDGCSSSPSTQTFTGSTGLILAFGVEIEHKDEIIIPLDTAGYSTCDIKV
jgi:hypothetical protein